MPDLQLRNLGAIVPGARTEPPPPAAAPPRGLAAAPAKAAPTGPAAAAASVFAADAADDPAALASPALGLDAPLARLAELASHSRTETPLAIGLLGPAGCGKSVALNKLVAAIGRLNAAARAGAQSPFVGRIVTLRIDASDLDGPAAAALAGALHAQLAAEAPPLAVEASHAARDPGVAARQAFERLDAARSKLEAERRALAESDARRARLAETLLYETPGSQVDAYVAGRRAPIKTAMRGFGIAGDPLLGFKDLIAEAADARAGARPAIALRDFWGLKGQARLIVTAAALALLGVALGVAFENRAAWLGLLRGETQTAAAADWMAAHADWLLGLRSAAFAGAALALGANLWRGARLLQMVFRGERLLKAELAGRRRDSDGHFGHQTRRVETLASEVERLSRLAAEAERRAGGLTAAASAEPSPFGADALKQEARRFIAAVGAMARKGAADAPRRIIVAIDNLDRAAPDRARDILAAARGLFGPGYVSLIAFDPARLESGGPIDLDSLIQAPLQIGEIAARRDPAAQINDLLGLAERDADAAPAAPDPARSALDEPVTEAETRLLAAFAPVAGPSARAVKRFVNLYRLLRADFGDAPGERGALAFMLALDAGGSAADLAAVHRALLGAGGPAAFEPHQIGPQLASAFAALGGRPGNDALRRAAGAARAFSLRRYGEDAVSGQLPERA